MPIPEAPPPPPSGGWDLARLREAVRRQLDVEDDEITDPEIHDAINAAYMEAIGDDLWPFLMLRSIVTIDNGVDEYEVETAIATDCEAHRIQSVTMGDRRLGYLAPTRLDSYQPYGISPGPTSNPTHYSVIANTLVLWPRPNANSTAEVRFLYLPPELEDDTDKPVFPARYHPIFRLGALAPLYDKLDDCKMGDRLRAQWNDALNKMRGDLLKPQPDSLWGWGEGEPLITWPPPLRFGWE